MRRLHAVLVAVLALGMLAGGTGLAGGIGVGIADSDGVQATALAHTDHGGPGAAQLECGYPLEITDATGTTVELTEEPAEVAALGASDAQTLWELGVREKVTGLPMFSATAYLENRNVTAGGRERTDIADEFGSPIPEEVVGLEPDLVLAASIISNETVTTLRQAGLTVYSAANEESLGDVYGTIEQIGRLVDQCDEAEQIVTDMESTVSSIESAVADEDVPDVYYAQVPGQGFTAGSSTVEDEIISVAGGQNIAAEAGVEFYGQLTEEEIVAQDPDWIVVGTEQEPPESLSTTTAVQEDQIVEVDPNALSQPGPRMVEPVQTIAETLHPEALAQDNGTNMQDNETGADGNETDMQDNETGADGNETDMQDNETGADGNETGADGNETGADGSGPGLTAVAALVALCVVAVVARRQV